MRETERTKRHAARGGALGPRRNVCLSRIYKGLAVLGCFMLLQGGGCIPSRADRGGQTFGRQPNPFHTPAPAPMPARHR